jgi:hypothetical protein
VLAQVFVYELAERRHLAAADHCGIAAAKCHNERALELGKVKRTLRPPHSRPRTDPDFYRKILLLYNELAARGERSPAKMLAEQMGEPVSTVHVWLHRAKRKFVGDA